VEVGPVGEGEREERRRVLRELEEWLEKPLFALSLVWIVLLILELARGLSSALEWLGGAIWVVFILDFLLRLFLAPEKGAYLKSNWLTLLSLFLPALRALRAFRLLRFLRLPQAARGARLVKTVGSINRGLRTLRARLGRRKFGFVLAATLLLAFVGAAAMLAFEREVDDPRGLRDYGSALWWTAMLLTTMGSEYWPKTLEGRLLCLFLAVYAFALFGYVTAALATLFLGRHEEEGEFQRLRQEVARLARALESRRKS
jgi:voltage-gated potassium channel